MRGCIYIFFCVFYLFGIVLVFVFFWILGRRIIYWWRIIFYDIDYWCRSLDHVVRGYRGLLVEVYIILFWLVSIYYIKEYYLSIRDIVWELVIVFLIYLVFMEGGFWVSFVCSFFLEGIRIMDCWFRWWLCV